MKNVFLSASIPLPSRDPKYFSTANNLAIRNSIKALLNTCIPTARITFGGHPAITPLISIVMSRMPEEYRKRVRLYVSDFFKDEFPKETANFIDVHFVKAKTGGREASLVEMRKQMIEDTPFDAAVFIGGMDGVLREYQTFKDEHPFAKLFPIATTGAAAKILFQHQKNALAELETIHTYSTLFRTILREISGPNYE